MCSKKIVLVGENGFHGDGRTFAFKIRLVRRLARQCGFDTLLFEASTYDFIEFSERIQSHNPPSVQNLSSAIGGIWNRNRDLPPFVARLYQEARLGRMKLGGLDDQLGSRGAFYSLEEMPKDLAATLHSADAEPCREALHRRIWFDIPTGELARKQFDSKLTQCLGAIKRAVSRDPVERRRLDRFQMVANIERQVARDHLEGSARLWSRDRSMADNLMWYIRSARKMPKIIVWSANAHAAKDVGAHPVFRGGRNFGSWIHEWFGEQSFSLGFSAASGGFRYSSAEVRPVAVATANSLEAKAIGLANTCDDAIYISKGQLQAWGTITASAFDDHQPVTADWSKIYDGVVVFRRETPVERMVSP